MQYAHRTACSSLTPPTRPTGQTGTHRVVVDKNRASPALSQAEAEARAMQSEVIPLRVEKRHLGGVDFNGGCLAIDVEGGFHDVFSVSQVIYSF